MEQVLIYQGEEMEDDEETMADYNIQVKDFWSNQHQSMCSK